jgi:signal transduction histidine kinase
MGAVAAQENWQRVLSIKAEKLQTSSLFLYNLLPENTLECLSWFPDDGKEKFPLNLKQENVQKILHGEKVFSGQASKFGEPFSIFPSPYLAVAPLADRGEKVGLLVAGLPKKATRSWLVLFENESENIAALLALQRLEEENRTLKEKLQTSQEKLNSAYRRLMEYNKQALLGRFAGGVAHELNTPLAAIQTYAEYLQIFLKGGADEEALDGILKAVSHAKQIVENVLYLSRERKLRILEPVYLEPIVHDALTFVSRDLEKKKIRLTLEIQPFLPPVLGDYTALVQLTTNLLTNARDAVSRQRLLPRAGEIALSLFLEENQNVLSIADNGVGISDENLGKIFDPFFTTKDIGEGTGLGLSICQAIVEEHNGTLEVLSQLGKGTTVMVKIPQYKEDFHV